LSTGSSQMKIYTLIISGWLILAHKKTLDKWWKKFLPVSAQKLSARIHWYEHIYVPNVQNRFHYSFLILFN
jgi:hypothetical protein